MSQKPPDQMTLVFLRLTRQVMAVATRSAVPSIAVPTGSETEEEKKKNAETELNTLVGSQLIVRDLPIKFFNVPAVAPFTPAPVAPAPALSFIKSGVVLAGSDLGVVTTDLTPALFRKSREYFIDSNDKHQRSFDPASITVHGTPTEVSVTLPAAVSEDTHVSMLVYVKNISKEPIPLKGVINPNAPDPRNKQCLISVPLPAGTYQFLTLVQGYSPAVYEQVVP